MMMMMMMIIIIIITERRTELVTITCDLLYVTQTQEQTSTKTVDMQEYSRSGKTISPPSLETEVSKPFLISFTTEVGSDLLRLILQNCIKFTKYINL